LKLTRVWIKNFRSIFDEPLTLELSEGMNALVGPNNCGKSNVLRAIRLALDPEYPFNRSTDMPQTLAWAVPKIELTFECDGKPSPEKTLLKYIDTYERSVEGVKKTNAEEGIIRFWVNYAGNERTGASRQETFRTKRGALQGDPELRKKALGQFRKALRFVMVESGQSMEDLLQSNFRDILHSVIKENLKDEFVLAEKRRAEYMDDLGDNLLEPLRKRISSVLCDLFPKDLTDASLVPSVSGIDETLSNVSVRLTDAVETPLENKGTGVRGGVMVAMLRYLSEHSQRSVVFAVEEPEAFLHPAAQEELRDDLEDLARRRDVTLLMTTHSPFVISREREAKVMSLAKSGLGRTNATRQASGNEPRASLLGDLFRDAALPDLMERAAEMPSEARAVLVVEGDTDDDYLRIATRVSGREDLLEGIHVLPAGGANKAVAQALITRATTDRSLMVLLDNDEPGKKAAGDLKGKFGFQGGEEVLTYFAVLDGPAKGIEEAEDLFSSELLEDFVRVHGEDILTEKVKLAGNSWHYGFSAHGKDMLPGFLEEHAKQGDVRRWIDLLELIRAKLGLDATGPEGALRGRPVEQAPDDGRASSAKVRATRERTRSDDVVVVPAGDGHGHYLRYSAYVCQAGRAFSASIERIGFYADKAIQREIPKVMLRRDGVMFAREEAERLRSTGDRDDARLAEVVERHLADGIHGEGDVQQVFLLSPPDNPDTLTLKRPVVNTKKDHKGSPTAWVQKQRYTRANLLAHNPATTDDLDRAERVL